MIAEPANGSNQQALNLRTQDEVYCPRSVITRNEPEEPTGQKLLGALNQFRINMIERQINQLDRRDRIRERAADRLRSEANRIEKRLRSASRHGLNGYEANDIQIRIARLEQQVRYSLANNNGRNGWNNNNGYNNYDRDRDGRDDRYEDDQGYRRDR